MITNADISSFFDAASHAIEREHIHLAFAMRQAAPNGFYAGRYPVGLYWKIREEIVSFVACRAGVAALAPRYAVVAEDAYTDSDRARADLAIIDIAQPPARRVGAIEVKWWSSAPPVLEDIEKLCRLDDCRRFVFLIGSWRGDRAKVEREVAMEVEQLARTSGRTLVIAGRHYFASGWPDDAAHRHARAFETYYVLLVEIDPPAKSEDV